MKLTGILGIVLLGLALALADSPPLAAQSRQIFVNTTSDTLPTPASWCVVSSEPCTLRAALDLAQLGGGVISACFEGLTACPAGRKPLRRDDPGFDPVTEHWVFRFDPKTFTPLGIDGDDVAVDFTQHIDGWASPADNRVVLDTGTEKTFNHMVVIAAANTVLAGFEVRGSFVVAAIVLRDGARDSVLGPGIVLAGISQGVGILLRGGAVTANRIVGSWCGLTGDGSVVDPVQDDCIVLNDGANLNVVGGPEPADRNVLAASKVGAGITLSGSATHENTVQGNYIGLDPAGEAAVGLEIGISLSSEASDNKILANIISGNRGSGILSVDASLPFGRTQTLVEGNWLGTNAAGELAIPNGGYGMRIEGESKNVKVLRNHIRFNRNGGVLVCGSMTRNNTISENSVTDNGGPGVQLCAGANAGVQPPAIREARPTHAAGLACAGCRIELFSDPGEQADHFEGATVADGTGAWSIDLPAAFRYPNLTATATDDLSTSGLSASVVVRADATATPSPTPRVSPTPEDTPTDQRGKVFLPWLARAAERTTGGLSNRWFLSRN